MAPVRKISIVIPTWNEADRIGNQLEQTLTLDAHEIVVVDGGSCDGTLEIARGLQVEVLAGPRGRARQQNLGAKHATGDVLLFLHADCVLTVEGMQQLQAASAGQECPCGAFVQRIDALGVVYRCLEWGNAQRVKLLGLPYGDQGIFVSKQLFDQVGGFPEVQLMEDVLLMKRLRRLVRPKLLPGPLLVDARRWKQYGVVRQTVRNWLLLAAFHLGVHPDRLARFYPAANGSSAQPR